MATIPLPEWPWLPVCHQAAERDVRLWLVGGAVRDLLLGRPVHDWDFVLERGALKLARAVADALGGAYFTLDAARETGRVIVTAPDGARQELDFATLRGGDLAADLATRDFTINAMAVDGSGALADPLGGEADLAARLVRATGERAFSDDPVRLLRAARFATELGFQIEPRTAAWIRQHHALLLLPSAERVRDELVRLIGLPGAAAGLRRLDEFGLLACVLPELDTLKGVAQSPPHHLDVWGHTLLTLEMLEGVVGVMTGRDSAAFAPAGDVARALGPFAGAIAAHLAVEISSGRDRVGLLRLAALLHDVGKPRTQSRDAAGRIHFYHHESVGAAIAADRLQALRFSRDEIERARLLVGQHMRPVHLAQSEPLTRRAVYRYFRATGCAGVDVLLLGLADHLAVWGLHRHSEAWERLLSVCETLLTEWFTRHRETIAPPPLLTGDDVIAELGLPPGPQIGQLLELAREAQAAGEVHTRTEALELLKSANRSIIPPLPVKDG